MHYNMGKSDLVEESIIKYCEISNEAAQGLTKTSEDIETVLKILNKCLSVIDQYSNKQNPHNELYYEIHNNIARCHNLQADIKKSLDALVVALQHVDQIESG